MEKKFEQGKGQKQQQVDGENLVDSSMMAISFTVIVHWNLEGIP